VIFKGDGQKGDLNGFLDGGSHINGELRFEDTFRVDGKVTGKIVSEGELLVGDKGHVDGDVEVSRAYISGRLQGRLRARIRVEITAGGRVEADIETPSLRIEDGAFFQGKCSMVPKSVPGSGASRIAQRKKSAG
jgi:cytoskeletal protein CcmA (bactofilin family)